jgi:DNA-directed RNA polymerase subunit M/transcription elongation factor TFIIS
MLLRAVDTGKSLEAVIHDTCGKSSKLEKDKFRSMMSVLIQYPHMRQKLLSNQLTCEAICSMKRDDFLTSELRRQKSEAEEARMNSQRTDWARAQDLKTGYKDSFFTCRKCKSKKTSYY